MVTNLLEENPSKPPFHQVEPCHSVVPLLRQNCTLHMSVQGFFSGEATSIILYGKMGAGGTPTKTLDRTCAAENIFRC